MGFACGVGVWFASWLQLGLVSRRRLNVAVSPLGQEGEAKLKEVAMQIREVADEPEGLLAAMSVEGVRRRDEPDRWSRQEILGHLIDSATSNHQRFMSGYLRNTAQKGHARTKC